jgi:myo-inositol-1-phosphate synthase
MKTVLAPDAQGAHARRAGLVLDEHPRQPRRRGARRPGELQDQGGLEARRARHILQPDLYPELYGDLYHKVRINYYPPRGDNKEGWDNIDIFGWLGYPMQIKVDFLCRDSILAAPIVLDLALFLDLAQRAGMKRHPGVALFYFKSPQHGAGLYPEHDLFIQQTKLKNTLRSHDGRGADHAPRHRVLRGASSS